MPATIPFGAFFSFFVPTAAAGLADDADQYRYGDDRDDHENEQ